MPSQIFFSNVDGVSRLFTSTFYKNEAQAETEDGGADLTRAKKSTSNLGEN